MIVSWQESIDDHGATVTDYEVEFRSADEVSYSTIDAHCNPIGGTTEFSNRQCTIPMAIFRVTPFELGVNSLIVGVVRATNNKGTSSSSDLNTSGVLVQNVPQGKLVLARGSSTSALQIELTWTLLSTNFAKGGSEITGYKIYWDNATQNGLFVDLESLPDGTLTNYITTSVQQGSTYSFKISALNIYGEGVESDEI